MSLDPNSGRSLKESVSQMDDLQDRTHEKSQKTIEIQHPVTENSSSAKDIDYLFETIVGGGGWGQWIILVAQYPIGVVSGLPLLIQMFAAYEPRHRCHIPHCDPELENESNGAAHIPIQTPWLNYTLPNKYRSSEMFQQDENFDPCKMFQMAAHNEEQDMCLPSYFNNTSVQKCDEYVYDYSVFEETLTTKLNLVCDEESKVDCSIELPNLSMWLGKPAIISPKYSC